MSYYLAENNNSADRVKTESHCFLDILTLMFKIRFKFYSLEI